MSGQGEKTDDAVTAAGEQAEATPGEVGDDGGTPTGVEDTQQGGPGEEERGGPHAEADGHGAPDKSPKRTEEHD